MGADTGVINIVVVAYEDAPMGTPWSGANLKGMKFTIYGEDSGRDEKGRPVITVRSVKQGMIPSKSSFF